MRRLWLLGPACVEQIPEPQVSGAEGITTAQCTTPVPRFRSKRTVGLLGYLVVERRPVSRDFLADLFWPQEAIPQGRSNLRRELHNLNQILPDCWDLDRQTVTFTPTADLSIDIATFQKIAAEGRWRDAAALLRGDFLEGLYLEDNPDFGDWLLGERERWRRSFEEVLARGIDSYMRRGQYSDALVQTQRLLRLAPWREDAHRRAMRLLAWTGQRGAALRQFETCKAVLRTELDVEPVQETITLYRQIREGILELPPQLPAFLTSEGARHEVDSPVFVTRERELAQLEVFLNHALAGQSKVVFITGGPGRGKTALLHAFARQMMQVHPTLLVASGNCSTYAEIGDPYQPFRDVMAMLAGDVESKWDAGAITREHAERLWTAVPFLIRAILDHGSDLVDVLIPSEQLLTRAMIGDDTGAAWQPRLRERLNRHKGAPQDLEQRNLFEQLTNVLHTLAHDRPLLLILDDIQWADLASVSLLFHLGRRISSLKTHILIACAYRPEEVAVTQAGERHQLPRVLNEFKRMYGGVWLDLGATNPLEGRRFIDALLAETPNRLGPGFREALHHRTEGHPLFTVELLRAMRERGDIQCDDGGYWSEGPRLDWEALPARIEAVIAERVERLDPMLQQILGIASVEGEVFTTQVTARVQSVDHRSLLHRLSQELERQHRLVREQEESYVGRQRLSRYRFRHALFQEYVYRQLSRAERRLYHGEVAAALESLFAGNLEEIATQLAHHYQESEDLPAASRYLALAADRAFRLYAHHESISYYSRALEMTAGMPPDRSMRASLHYGRGLAYGKIGEFDQARSDLETVLEIALVTSNVTLEWQAMLELGRLWASRNYDRAGDYFRGALQLAERVDDATVLANSLNWMGNWYANNAESPKAIDLHQRALQLIESLGDRHDIANTLDLLGLAYLLSGDLAASVVTYNRAITLCQESHNRPRLVTSLIARSVNVSLLVMLASVPAPDPPDANGDLEKAIQYAREIDSAVDVTWALWALGLLQTVEGRFGQALASLLEALRIAVAIGHREYEVANRLALGLLYVEVLAIEQAQSQLRRAGVLAAELHSQLMIRYIAGAQAAAHLLVNDVAGAESSLEPVLSSRTPMNTMGNRYCWLRRAEIALAQGDMVLADEIVERLVASAPGISSTAVVPYLWKLRAEVLMAFGQVEEAELLIRAAMQTARTAGMHFLIWRLQASLGRILIERGEAVTAEDEFAEASECIARLGSTMTNPRLRSTFSLRALKRIRGTDHLP